MASWVWMRPLTYAFIFPAYIFAIIFGKPKDILKSERTQIDSYQL